MKTLQKVLWAEGLLLGQQHFQQWDNYHHARTHYLLRTLVPFYAGISLLDIDEVSLSVGKLIIKKCRAIFPHGLIIDYDDTVLPPLTYALNTLTTNIIEIYLAIPSNTFATGISGYSAEAQACAWSANYKSVVDEFDNAREREVLFGIPELRLLSGNDERGHYHALKILEIHQEGLGRFNISTTFIPSILQVGASTLLKNLLRSQIELISAKIRLLQNRRKQFRSELSEFNHSDLADFLLLQLFNSVLPYLQFYLRYSEVAPQMLYQTLASFIENLATFQECDAKGALPEYDHEHLSETFFTCHQCLTQLLESVIPTRMLSLKLSRESDILYVSNTIDSSFFAKSSFYLAVWYEATNVNWLHQFVRQVKIGSRSSIEAIVASALPGVALVHTQRPPNKLPIKAGYEYFYLTPSGVFWEQIKAEQLLALFTSYDFTNAHIELITVQD